MSCKTGSRKLNVLPLAVDVVITTFSRKSLSQTFPSDDNIIFQFRALLNTLPVPAADSPENHRILPGEQGLFFINNAVFDVHGKVLPIF